MAGKKKGKSGYSRLSAYRTFAPVDLAVAPIDTVVAGEEITAKMKELVLSQFLNPKYSDLSIMCGDEIFPAHRNIVCPQSTYFEIACDGRFKEGNGEIRLDDRDPMLIRKMLEFLYIGDYTYEAMGDFDAENDSGDLPQTDLVTDLQADAGTEVFSHSEANTSSANPRTGQAFFHAQMYAQGAYFQIDGLKTRAKEYFEKSFMKFPDRESFTSAVLEVYDSTGGDDRGLRDLVIQMTTDNLLLLRAGENPILDRTLLEMVPNFMLDICLSALDRCAKHQRAYKGVYYDYMYSK